jgi:tRNA (mo5U34)-methyltransferase
LYHRRPVNTTAPAIDVDAEAVRSLVAEHPLWYHTMELAPGVVTPGWFDLRPIVDLLPWPDVRGMRCLEVGPYDGFLSFELERRGAAEVVAADIGASEDWDWPPRVEGAPRGLKELVGPEVGAGFRIAKRLLSSSVERVVMSAYDLSEERMGRFDVVVCGSLLLHLRDPLRALEAIRSVCGNWFLSAEQIRLGLSLRNRRRPLAELNGADRQCQWWVPNAAGHRRMIYAAGFDIERHTRPYAVPFGPRHPRASNSLVMLRHRALTRLATGRQGVPHAAVLARPAA